MYKFLCNFILCVSANIARVHNTSVTTRISHVAHFFFSFLYLLFVLFQHFWWVFFFLLFFLGWVSLYSSGVPVSFLVAMIKYPGKKKKLLKGEGFIFRSQCQATVHHFGKPRQQGT